MNRHRRFLLARSPLRRKFNLLFLVGIGQTDSPCLSKNLSKKSNNDAFDLIESDERKIKGIISYKNTDVSFRMALRLTRA